MGYEDEMQEYHDEVFREKSYYQLRVPAGTYSSDNIFSLIHNGIIENHYSIKEYLISKGIKFKSDTDTEVLVQFISYIYKKEKLDFYNTVKAVLKEVKGTYGIVVMCKDEPQKLVAAKNGKNSVKNFKPNQSPRED